MSDSYADIRDRWTFTELCEALVVLDALDAADEKVRAKQAREAEIKARQGS